MAASSHDDDQGEGSSHPLVKAMWSNLISGNHTNHPIFIGDDNMYLKFEYPIDFTQYKGKYRIISLPTTTSILMGKNIYLSGRRIHTTGDLFLNSILYPSSMPAGLCLHVQKHAATIYLCFLQRVIIRAFECLLICWPSLSFVVQASD